MQMFEQTPEQAKIAEMEMQIRVESVEPARCNPFMAYQSKTQEMSAYESAIRRLRGFIADLIAMTIEEYWNWMKEQFAGFKHQHQSTSSQPTQTTASKATQPAALASPASAKVAERPSSKVTP